VRRALFVILASVALSASAERKADIQISVAEMVGYGIFETRSSARHTGFSRSKMAADVVSGIRFTDFTNEIPGVLGTNFGFQYIINTTPRGQKLRLKSVIRFPEQGLQQPGGRLYKESIEYKQVTIGARDLHGYGFDEPWEIVPGDWVFEVWYKDARLIRKTFSVLPPATGDSEQQ
jgi:hypothetical protein